MLPDQKELIYTSFSTPIDRARIVLYSLETQEHRVLVQGASYGRWTTSGHLVYVRGEKLWAAPFDLETRTLTGNAEPVLDDVHYERTDGYSNLVIAENGTLVYVPASVMGAPRELVSVDRTGQMTPLDFAPRIYGTPRLAPNGRGLAMDIHTNQNTDVWLYDLQRGTGSRLTFFPASDFSPVWTPDGKSIYYCREEPQFSIYRRAADGSGDPELALMENVDTVPTSVSPDGSRLVFTRSDVVTDSDIWILPLDGSGDAQPLVRTPFSESMGQVSPDGDWIAYVSNESGREEVYAMAFPTGRSRIQVSIEGGNEPQWSRAGDEIFFRHRSGVMTAPVDLQRSTESSLAVGRPAPLFTGPFDTSWFGNSYTPTPDGQDLIMVHIPPESLPRTVNVVLNWFSELPSGEI